MISYTPTSWRESFSHCYHSQLHKAPMGASRNRFATCYCYFNSSSVVIVGTYSCLLLSRWYDERGKKVANRWLVGDARKICFLFCTFTDEISYKLYSNGKEESFKGSFKTLDDIKDKHDQGGTYYGVYCEGTLVDYVRNGNELRPYSIWLKLEQKSTRVRHTGPSKI